MKKSFLSIIIPASLILMIIAGCNSLMIKSAGEKSIDAVSVDSVISLAEDTCEVISEDSVYSEEADTVLAEPDEEWSEMTTTEKMDSTEKLLDAALTMQEEGDIIVAQYYYTQMRNLMETVDENDSELDSVKYDFLVDNINHYYHDYISQYEVLPEGMSPEAVLAGVEMAEGDTLNGNGDLFEKPEVEIDAAELEAALESLQVFPSVPIDIDNRKVKKAIEFFQKKGRKVYTKWLERAEYNIGPMQRILREEGLPEELVYLAMIESGFNPKAYSYAHASGPWQFIRSTGKIFGLKSSWWYDERRDPEKATRAAAKYLKKLYLDFDDWYLALAAYNCGEGRVKRHIRHYGTKDFWKLKKLPRQTRNYVPTYLAAAAIAMNPTEYGFEEIVLKNPAAYDSVLVGECIDLKLIGELTGTNYNHIRELNPAIVRWCTPPDVDSIWVNIPFGQAENFHTGLKNIPEDQKRSWVRHKIKRGEALSTIARKYGTSQKAIMDIKSNNISSRHRIKEGKYLLIPVPPHKYRGEWAGNEPDDMWYPPESGDKSQYTVRKGDNLSIIAARYGTSVSKLKRWNNLWGKRFIYPGQKLVIWQSGNANKAKNPGKESSGSLTAELQKVEDAEAPVFHTVRRGDNLSFIAKRYGVSVNSLKRLNGLTGRCLIKPGDKIKLPGGSSTGTKSVHVVRRGDTLWEIAVAYGVRLSDLQHANSLTGSSVIRPGDRISIPN